MKIVVLAGGTSTERDVSLNSGSKICKTLLERGHQAILLDVFLGLEDVDMDTVFDNGAGLLEGVKGIEAVDPDIEAIKALRKDGGKTFFGPNVLELCREADVVFMALHGENGENGKVQAAFDLFDITYTGNDYLSSALAMDKALAKELFHQYNIPTPEGYAVKDSDNDTRKPAYPAIVKVTDGGSSVGVVIVNNDAEYEAAKKECFKYGHEVVVEQFIKGREFSVGVIEGQALPVIEIQPVEGFYDYKNKYQAGSAIETCPAVLTDEQTRAMQKIAVDVYYALRLNQYARMDVLMNEAGEMFCLEANTLPGMTPTSLLPQEAAAVGINYGDLCEKLINMALNKKK